MTRELMHFPGHMESIVQLFKELYQRFGIQFASPVRDWDTPVDQQFVDRLIVDQHGYLFPSEKSKSQARKTTGQYLFDKGFFDHPNIKGSPKDQSMQQDCYPFVLYNIMVFWMYFYFFSYEEFVDKVTRLMKQKVDDLLPLLKSHLKCVDESPLAVYVE
jgi:hypothetical protein